MSPEIRKPPGKEALKRQKQTERSNRPAGRQVPGPWFRVAVSVLGDPKLVHCSAQAQLAFIYGLAYCARHQTDGKISKQALAQICQGFLFTDIERVVLELIENDLWKAVKVKHSLDWQGYEVKNYLLWQSGREEIEAKRRGTAARVAKYRANARAEASQGQEPDNKIDLVARIRRTGPAK